MNDAQKIVLDLTSAALFGGAGKSLDGNRIYDSTDWQAVYEEIDKQRLVALLYPLAKDLDLPEDVLRHWSLDRDRYILNNAKVIGGHFAIQKLMDERGVPCIILKGLASAKYYPDHLLRGFGDVDFLVQRDDYKKATEILSTSGFEFVNLHDKHRIYSRHEVIYELHRDIVGIPAAPLDEAFDRFFSDIFDEAVVFERHGSKCVIPSHRHHAVILLIHTAYHLAHTGVGLRHICDWAAFVHKMPGDFFEVEMKPILREMGIWHFAGVLTCLCMKYLGLPRCDWVEEPSEKYLAEIIDDVFSSGEFGRIEEDAAPSDSDHRSRGDELLRASTIRAFFASLNRGAKTVIPASAEHPILLPAGWVFITGRYMARILTGKRTAARARDNIVRLGRRRELIEDLRLFEGEKE